MTPMEQARERVRAWQSGLLDLSDLGLTELPELPAGLTEFYCCRNQLTRLPETLPADLEVLSFEANHLPPHKYGESIAEYIARAVVAETESRERIVARCALVFEELAQKVWHPQRVERRMLAGVDM